MKIGVWSQGYSPISDASAANIHSLWRAGNLVFSFDSLHSPPRHQECCIRTAKIRCIREDPRAIGMHSSPRMNADPADQRGSRLEEHCQIEIAFHRRSRLWRMISLA